MMTRIVIQEFSLACALALAGCQSPLTAMGDAMAAGTTAPADASKARFQCTGTFTFGAGGDVVVTQTIDWTTCPVPRGTETWTYVEHHADGGTASTPFHIVWDR